MLKHHPRRWDLRGQDQLCLDHRRRSPGRDSSPAQSKDDAWSCLCFWVGFSSCPWTYSWTVLPWVVVYNSVYSSSWQNWFSQSVPFSIWLCSDLVSQPPYSVSAAWSSLLPPSTPPRISRQILTHGLPSSLNWEHAASKDEMNLARLKDDSLGRRSIGTELSSPS